MALPLPSLPASAADRVLFDAVLTPHRSLSPFGFALLMLTISAISFVTGVFFVIKGAWPVTGFFGLDVLLLYIAFRINYRAARLYETVRLTEETLVVERVGPGRRRKSWSFQPYWLRISMDDPPKHASQLILASHGRAIALGTFLAPAERAELARALDNALQRARTPHFLRPGEAQAAGPG
jgi:uncharacterized membrane protein